MCILWPEFKSFNASHGEFSFQYNKVSGIIGKNTIAVFLNLCLVIGD